MVYIGRIRLVHTRRPTMGPEDFKAKLIALRWKQSDFCAKTGVNRDTTSRWSNGHTPIPAWVDAYLGAIMEIQYLHNSYVAPRPFDAVLAEQLSRLRFVRIQPVPKIVGSPQKFAGDRFWSIREVDLEHLRFTLKELSADWVEVLAFNQVEMLTTDHTAKSPDGQPSGILVITTQMLLDGKTIRHEPRPEYL